MDADVGAGPARGLRVRGAGDRRLQPRPQRGHALAVEPPRVRVVEGVGGLDEDVPRGRGLDLLVLHGALLRLHVIVHVVVPGGEVRDPGPHRERRRRVHLEQLPEGGAAVLVPLPDDVQVAAGGARDGAGGGEGAQAVAQAVRDLHRQHRAAAAPGAVQVQPRGHRGQGVGAAEPHAAPRQPHPQGLAVGAVEHGGGHNLLQRPAGVVEAHHREPRPRAHDDLARARQVRSPRAHRLAQHAVALRQQVRGQRELRGRRRAAEVRCVREVPDGVQLQGTPRQP